ncbi:MAG: T9SS type A sorting domain-containing protein [Flavobacterium sp.]
MNQIYFVLQQAIGLSAKKQAEGFTSTQSPGGKSTSLFAAFMAVMLFSCFGAYAQTDYYSKATATDFNDVNSWGTATDGTGTAPAALSNADNFIVANSAALTLSGNATVRRLAVTSGTLTVAANTLTVGIAAQKNSVLLINGGTLTVTGGAVNIDGYLSFTSGNFNQSGGAILLDPNNAGATATSTTALQFTLELRAAVNWTGGSITVLDPPASTSATHYSLYYNVATSSEVGSGHTLNFGDGTSADAGGNAIGFLLYNWIGDGKVNFGNVNVYGPSANNRKVKQVSWTNGIKNNLRIYANGELDQNAIGLIVGGNITVDATATWTASSTVTFAMPQGSGSVVNPNAQVVIIDAAGTLRNAATAPTGNFTTFVLNNSSAGGLTINGTSNVATQPTNSISANTLTFTAGRITTTGGARFIMGNSLPTAGTLNYTSGGFVPGTTVGRWYTATGTGSAIAAGVDVASTTSRYPFVSAAGLNRSAWIERVTPSAAAGIIAITYNEVAGTSAVSIPDDTYTVNLKGNDTWAVSALQGNPLSAASFKFTAQAPLIFGVPPLNGNVRVIQGSGVAGTHQAGTATPGGQRIAMTGAQLTAAPFSLGINTADLPVQSVASGSWDNGATWSTGVVPDCNTAVSVSAGHTVTVASAANTAKGVNIAAGGILILDSGDLTVGCTLNNAVMTNSGSFIVNGGTLTLNGSINNTATASFAQLGGAIVIDGNNGTLAESVASGTPMFAATTGNINLSAGTLTFVDPHLAATAGNGHVINFNVAANNVTSLASSPSHTTYFGDGVSTQAGGHANGFFVAPYVGTGYLALGTVVVNGGSGTNRNMQVQNMLTANGNLTVNAGSLLTANNITFGGNFTVEGTVVNSNSARTGVVTASAGTLANFTYGPATIAQTIETVGAGSINNLAATPTADFAALTINNTSTGGVTIANAFDVSGTLTLTEGKINTTTVNMLSVGTATAAGTVTGGSATAYVNGPLTRTIGSGNAATNFIAFPVGKTAYAPIAAAPVTTAVSVMKAEAFDSNTGTANASIINLATGRRWEAPIVSGTVTSINVRVGDANLVDGNIPVTAPTADGEYASTFGSVATFAAGTPNTVTANAAIPFANYSGFVSYASANVCATPAPGNTIASANNICFGQSVTLSVQNATAGAGVSYQWQSSVNGTDNWTDIATAMGTTYTTTPSSALYYRLNVTCSTGPSTVASAPLQVNFGSNLTATTNGTRCGAGVVELTATPSAGATVVWFDAAVNGTQVATGNTYSPNLTASTTFYAAAQSVAAVTATVGTGTTTTSTNGVTPFTSNWEGSRTQYLVKASELTAAGLSAGSINSLAFDISAVSAYVQNGYTIKISHTSLEALTAYATGSFTTVYGPVALPIAAQTGLRTFNFTNAFQWDGTSNIVIEICHDNDLNNTCTDCYGTNGTVRYTATTFNSVYGRFADNVAVCGLEPTANAAANSMNRPNMVFGNNGCFSGRTAVTATVNTAPAFTISSNAVTICAGATSQAVTVTAGGTDYDTYNWTPSTGVSGNATTGWTFNPTVTTTYTLNATQSVGAMCAASATVAVSVNLVPTAITVAPLSGNVCIGNTVALTATGGQFAGQATIGTATTLTGDTEQPTAFMNRWTTFTMQTVYTAAELNAAGLYAGRIGSMTFNTSTNGSALTNTNYTVRIGATTASSYATATYLPTTDLTTVFGPQTYTRTAPGLQTITFSTPYLWDGVSNIVVHITMGGANSTNNSRTYFTETTDNTVVWHYNAIAPAMSKKRLNVTFASSDAVTVKWSPDTNLFTDAAATTPYIAGTNAAVVYVKPSAAATTAYTVTAETNNNCSVQAGVTVTSVDCAIGWGNLQWPPTITMNTCGSETVYGKVWKMNVTEANGANANMKAWVGISTTNTNPASWTESQWNMAEYNVQSGNDDEYKYAITGQAAGTYYYAYRYQYLDGAYYYGGYNSGGGGAWGGGNVSGVLTVNAVAAPTAADQAVCAGKTVADLVVTGTAPKWYTVATNGTALASTDIVTAGTYYVSQTIDGCESTRTMVEVTISSFDAPQATVTQPTCSVATGTITVTSLGAGYTYSINGTDFQTELAFTAVTPNTYTLTAKNSLGCTMTSSVTVNAQPTAPATPTVTPTQPTCSVATGTIEVSAPTGTGMTYSIDGVNYQASGTFSGLTANTYSVTAKNADGCVSEAASVVINTQPVTPVADAPANVTVCDSYVLPALSAGNNYYTATNGGGTMLNAGNVITSNQTIFVFLESAGCSDEESFTVTVNQSPNIGTFTDVTACNSYALPNLTVGNYYTATGGAGTQLAPGFIVTSNQTIYVYAASATTPNCTAEDSFDVVITTSPAQPTGAPTQSVTVANPADATIEDLVATAATGTISWYASEANALSGTSPLAAGTQLVNGNIYYATAASGTCYSTTALAVTVSVVLGRDDFSFTNLKYYPNPVTDKLTISHSSAITSVEVYNLLGQIVISERPNTTTAEVNMAQLQQATYIVRISADGKSKDFKVVKK